MKIGLNSIYGDGIFFANIFGKNLIIEKLHSLIFWKLWTTYFLFSSSYLLIYMRNFWNPQKFG